MVLEFIERRVCQIVLKTYQKSSEMSIEHMHLI